jgi:hypothetical protein
MYGNIQLPTPYKINEKYLVLKCNDQYEHLCEKTIYLCKIIYHVFPSINGMFKCDDDIVPNIKNINNLIHLVTTNDIQYLGYTWNTQDYYSTWHYNKCSSSTYNVPKLCHKCDYAAGPLYYLNRKSLYILINTSIDYNQYFFEDSMVGHILNKHNIAPYNMLTHTDNISDLSTSIHNCNHHKYIYVVLLGGIGNQLFQLSIAYTLAKRHNMFIVLLIQKDYKNTMPYNKTYNEFMDTIFSSFNYTYYENIDVSKITIYNEDNLYTYNPSIIQHNTDYLLIGYFQHKKYFDPEILPLFKNNEICNYLTIKYPFLKNSYFIHFRLRNYLTSEIYSFDKDTYYTKSIDYVLTIHKDAHFYVLSDDVDFIKTYPLLNTINKTIITESDTLHSLYLMSLCHYGGICANSTFSGWGAKLNENKDKIVICPKQWINRNCEYEIPFDCITL